MNFIEVCKQNKPFKVKGARSPGQYYVKPRTRTLCHFMCLDKSDERELNSNQILNLMNHDEFELVEPKIVPLSEKSNSVGDMYNTYKTGKRFVKTYIEEDIKLALEELLAYFESGRIGPYTSLQEKIKEIFGSDLL